MIVIIYVLLTVIICALLFLIIKKTKNSEIQIEDLQSENIEQNKRLIFLEKEIKYLKIGIDNEKRDNCRKNKTSYKSIR